MTLDRLSPIAYLLNFDHIHMYLICYYFTKKHCCFQYFKSCRLSGKKWAWQWQET